MTRIRLRKTINGRDYLIDVRPVPTNRWRAEIAAGPGRFTALMPFYGATPDEAAALLSSWLTRAGRKTA